ncbi:hypothetical protein SAMN05920897_101321 [Alkalispirochaeta americana]|uniref:Uncharacterized protein n=1 Tax=Alkalispirochaeta americana TaxID=159291 RepID=A0A1N6NM42_9SPIO|nr:hypothetical protein [Alkalispirochaeta americana]SIP93046.1 hypothetical protein SAMN05920897_101321 [Alkalispirochaeta americana]
MTTAQFIRKLEGYYGKEFGEASDVIEQWIVRKVPETDLPLLFAEVVRTISARYKTLPGIKELHDAWGGVRGRQTKRYDWRGFACRCFPDKGGTMISDGPLQQKTYLCARCGQDVRAEDWTEYPINATTPEIAGKFGVKLPGSSETTAAVQVNAELTTRSADN